MAQVVNGIHNRDVHLHVVAHSYSPIAERDCLEVAITSFPMVLGDVQVVADQLEDEDGFELVLECGGALLNQVFQHIGRSASTIGRPCVLDWLYINGQTLELCLMAIITLSVPVAREQGAGVGEGAKLFRGIPCCSFQQATPRQRRRRLRQG